MASESKPVAIVTGASRGIGHECARVLARAGFNLVLNDLKAFDCSIAEEAGAECVCVPGDVGVLATHAGLIDAGVSRWGRLDCLVNNAGVGVISRGDLLEVTAESFDRCLQVNARAVFFLSQAVARHLLTQGQVGSQHRCIVNITSSNAVAASILRSEYCVSKAAAGMITRLFALRLAEAGIGVYEIRPGVIDTEMTRPVKDYYDERISAADDPLVPMKRWGHPTDVADTVCMMAEGRMSYATGQAIAVDGGMTILRY